MYSPGQYIAGNTPVHTRDPRVKLIAVIGLSLIIFQANGRGLLVVAVLSLTISWLARIPMLTLLRTLRPTLPFFGLLFMLYALFTPGSSPAFLTVGPLHITSAGLCFGALQIGRFLLLVITASILTMTTSPSEITMGLERLLRPLRILRISSHDIAMMVSLSLRFLPTLMEEINTIREAQMARGANFSPRQISGKIHSMRLLSIPLMFNVIRRCDELIDAMESRGYQTGSRTYLRELVMSQTDYLLIGLIIAATLVLC